MSYIIDHDNIEILTKGNSHLAAYPFEVSGTRYTCWFTELTSDDEGVENTVMEIEDEFAYQGFDIGPGTFKVDFDLEERFQRFDDEELFHIPKGGFGNSIRDLLHISCAIVEIIEIHQTAFNCVFFFAEPATDSHVRFYEWRLIPMLDNIGYIYSSSGNGDSYIFLKELDEEIENDQ
ncbi:conserved hypothetical protein [Vibrio chagasii]|nr:conserved hypothetical protein [Vibrio chagasii]